MNMVLERLEREAAYTMGHMYVDGAFECWVLEDPVREGAKIHGKTAIPEGTYRVVLDFSARFKKIMPHLLDVPGFAGIRIHSGNTVEDTDGCLLVGSGRRGPTVTGSRKAFGPLMARLTTSEMNSEETWITVTHTD